MGHFGTSPLPRSELILSNIHVSANGEWECAVSTSQGNVSKKVEIVVLETSASYCPAERVTNNRGDFRWGPVAVVWPRGTGPCVVRSPLTSFPPPVCGSCRGGGLAAGGGPQVTGRLVAISGRGERERL